MPTKNATARKPSARKRARQAINARSRNFSDRTKARSAVKKVRAAIVSNDDAIILDSLTNVNATLDKTARKRVIHRNKVARLKSRLNSAAKKAKAPATASA